MNRGFALERIEIIRVLRSRVSENRFQHCLGVEAIALQLATRFGVSETLVSPAALLHDLCREYPADLLLKLATKFDIVIDNIELDEPMLLHGVVGAMLARDELGIKEPLILEAITYHITGAPQLSALGQLIFVADMIEPGRKFKLAEQLRRAAFEIAPEQLLLKIYNHTIEYLIRRGYTIHPRTVAGRNELIQKGVLLTDGTGTTENFP
ncbi:MAG TPA: bis(5'-nucleosyl)-tetraphosphatase (symmetrical) YqeK [Bacillota bacterium]|nr:bis(5'-nucleosyl)-tetraphosphatase (symmetrical) YqeK [Bacillota bacterium]